MSEPQPRQVEADWDADVSAQRVAKVYAEALLNAADKHGQMDAALEDYDALVRDVLSANADFEKFLTESGAGRERKEALIHKVFDGRAGETFVNFLLVLNAHDRLDLLRLILVEAHQIRNRRANRVPVHVASAVPLADEQRERLVRELRGSFQVEPLLDLEVDPNILGGLVVRVGDWLFDGSVRSQLETLRTQLIERSSYEIQSRRDRFSSPNGD
jgi:F-type H+-transporting ATPase subunit delta